MGGPFSTTAELNHIFTRRVIAILSAHFILDIRRADLGRMNTQGAQLSLISFHFSETSHASLPRFVVPLAGPIQPRFLSQDYHLWEDGDHQPQLQDPENNVPGAAGVNIVAGEGAQDLDGMPVNGAGE